MEATQTESRPAQQTAWGRGRAYQDWIESTGLPIHRGYYVDDLRTVELGWWAERQCNAAFMELAGQEGVSEVRVTEVPPAKSTAPVRLALDELVYVVEGRGLTTIRLGDRSPVSFEWQKHSLFRIPRNFTAEFSNTQGDRGARLLHYNSLPLAMQLIPDPDFFFKNAIEDPSIVYGAGDAFYSEAKVVHQTETGTGRPRGAYWIGNFFPDMRAWDQLIPFKGRGAGGHVVWIRYPGAPVWNHMSVFPSKTYKKAHRHGPGTLIVIPTGEGYSYMWPEGGEKVFIPWHEASVFVPPNRWFHQHFNVSDSTDRYLAFHAPRGAAETSERVEDLARDQIEYPDEDPIIRNTFESELAKRGLKSLMPDQAYKQRDFEWDYGDE
ncbi:MAG TPA: cupin domain-containing protein [Chloroflexota bacterium]|nr:cupin domain-containing protein [Chloroflexota bacterium]